MNFENIINLVLASTFGAMASIAVARLSKTRQENNKTEADEEAALSGAVEGAGKTLENAWKRIGELETRLREYDKVFENMRRELRRMERELGDYRNHVAKLNKQLIEKDITPAPFELTPETQDRIKAFDEERNKFQENRKAG